MHKIVAITGLPGSGKSVASDYFSSRGYNFVRLGQITLDEIISKGLEVNEKNEKAIRERIRKDHGMAAFAILNTPKINKLLEKGNVILDGLYSFAEYDYFKKKYSNKITVIAVYAPPKLRYKRISTRVMPKDDKDLRHRPFSVTEAKNRDYAQLTNLDMGATIAMADYTILNTRGLKFIDKQLNDIYQEIS